MSQQGTPVQSVWLTLWQGNPLLYLALNLSMTANTALVILLLVAVFSEAYDQLRLYLSRRTRQTYSYILVDDKLGAPTSSPGLLSLLARTSRGPRSIVWAKAMFNSQLFISVQYTINLLVVQIARIIASTFTTNRNVRRQCTRLLAKGLECSVATRHHDWLNILAAIGLLCFIRGFQLHVELPNRQSQQGDYSPGFLSLYSSWRRTTQRLLAAPIAVIVLHARVSRDDLWKHAKLVVIQVAGSIGLFLAGNLVCLVAAFPDVQDTLHALEVSGLTGKTEVRV
ncbi:hypothetical protein G6011_06102 [Alternaria panax]|uniref:Uncharacterized protein n=1 Tax=Alternaria panax TaxID=48097 RepID=A0AAD4FEU1_9PLEO|nr:hypothetical protein G6011_06102 [Alternaria panax]